LCAIVFGRVFDVLVPDQIRDVGTSGFKVGIWGSSERSVIVEGQNGPCTGNPCTGKFDGTTGTSVRGGRGPGGSRKRATSTLLSKSKKHYIWV
jgi:hypothetical protein